MSEKHIGKVLQVIGPVLDIQFEDEIGRASCRERV